MTKENKLTKIEQDVVINYIRISGLIPRMYNRLKEMGLDGMKIIRLLKRSSNCIMSGSFPLQVLLNEKYEDSDIDFFVDHKEPKYDFDFTTCTISNDLEMFCALNAQNKTLTYGYVGDYVGDYESVCKPHYHKIDPRIDSTVTYELNKNKLQFVKVDAGEGKLEMIDYINRAFDFSFCKVAFDGEYFLIHRDIFNDVMNKKGEWFTRNFESIENEVIRMNKYKKRGFTITNEDKLQKYLDGDDVTDRTKKLFELRKRDEDIVDKLIESEFIVLDTYIDMGGNKRLLAYSSATKSLQLLHSFESVLFEKLQIVKEYCELYPEKHVKCPDGDKFIFPE